MEEALPEELSSNLPQLSQNPSEEENFEFPTFSRPFTSHL